MFKTFAEMAKTKLTKVTCWLIKTNQTTAFYLAGGKRHSSCHSSPDWVNAYSRGQLSSNIHRRKIEKGNVFKKNKILNLSKQTCDKVLNRDTFRREHVSPVSPFPTSLLVICLYYTFGGIVACCAVPGWKGMMQWQVAVVVVIITAHEICKQTGSPTISSQHVAVGTAGCIANLCHRLQTVGVH